MRSSDDGDARVVPVDRATAAGEQRLGEMDETNLLEGKSKREASDAVQVGAKYGGRNGLLCACALVAGVGVFLQTMIYTCRDVAPPTDKYWVYSARSDVDDKNGLLRHVHSVLERLGYDKSTDGGPWTLLWSHDYPFGVLRHRLRELRPHQKVNHFPGTGFITNKVDLATGTLSDYIPKAFRLPAQRAEFLRYAEEHEGSLFLEKNNQHRGVRLKNVSEVDAHSGERFVQEFVQRPLLVNGHRFDVGVYVLLTSVNPLRLYWYKGDVLLRYCRAKYHPFDPSNTDSYVVGDDYLPTWEVPSLARPYAALRLSMKGAFDAYLRSQGRDPASVWVRVRDAIVDVFLKKEHHIVEALKHYPSRDNFFELMRFDLIVDEDLKVYLLEANMSPNLSSAHYPPNQLLYEQVLYSLFSITGVASNFRSKKKDTAATNMISSDKNIAVWGLECDSTCAAGCARAAVCELCRPCLPPSLRRSLRKAHYEFLHRADFGRLYPHVMTPDTHHSSEFKNITENNKLQHLWFQGKCNEDITWCS